MRVSVFVVLLCWWARCCADPCAVAGEPSFVGKSTRTRGQIQQTLDYASGIEVCSPLHGLITSVCGLL